MYLEGSGIGEGAQHISALYNMLNSAAVVLLIQKVTGLLSIFNINIEFQPIFLYHDLGIKRGREKPFLLGQSFQFTYRHIIAFKNTPLA